MRSGRPRRREPQAPSTGHRGEDGRGRDRRRRGSSRGSERRGGSMTSRSRRGSAPREGGSRCSPSARASRRRRERPLDRAHGRAPPPRLVRDRRARSASGGRAPPRGRRGADRPCTSRRRRSGGVRSCAPRAASMSRCCRPRAGCRSRPDRSTRRGGHRGRPLPSRRRRRCTRWWRRIPRGGPACRGRLRRGGSSIRGL